MVCLSTGCPVTAMGKNNGFDALYIYRFYRILFYMLCLCLDNRFYVRDLGHIVQIMDQLIDSIEIELNKEKRKKLWGKLQRLYAEQIPVIPLYFRANSFIVPKWLKGIRPTGHMFTSTNWVEDWHVIK